MGCRTADIGDDCTTSQSYQLRHDNCLLPHRFFLTRGQTHGHALTVVPISRERGLPIDVPTAEGPANRGVATLLAIPRMAKRKTGVGTNSLRSIPLPSSRSEAASRISEVPAETGKCAQGDSNSHGPNGPQGPQPCAACAFPVQEGISRTIEPARWTPWTDWTGWLLSRCCHAMARERRGWLRPASATW